MIIKDKADGKISEELVNGFNSDAAQGGVTTNVERIIGEVVDRMRVHTATAGKQKYVILFSEGKVVVLKTFFD